MKRDMDLVRDLLLAIEDGLEELDPAQGLPGKNYTEKQLVHHLNIMVEHGLIKDGGALIGGPICIDGLTWEGHDFADTLRDPEIYKQAKSAAATVGGVGFKALVEIGKAVAKQKLQELGLPIP